jgi:GLPGLI family protein
MHVHFRRMRRNCLIANTQIWRRLISAVAILAFISGSCMAQQNEGVIRYLVTSNWVKMMKSVDYLSKEQTERMSYMWGNNAEWKTYATLYFSDSRTKYEDSEEKADSRAGNYAWRKTQYCITRDLVNLQIRDLIEMLGKVYIIEDTLVFPEWKILNDLKEVAGHICMNAVWIDTLKKQRIVAWFALDMPVSGGPERSGGLPGMILELDINDGAKVISADKIDMQKLGDELEFPSRVKGNRIQEAEYHAILRKHFDDKRKAEQSPFWGIRY